MTPEQQAVMNALIETARNESPAARANVLEQILDKLRPLEDGPEDLDPKSEERAAPSPSTPVTTRQNFVEQRLNDLSERTPLIGALLKQSGLDALLRTPEGRLDVVRANRDVVQEFLGEQLDGIIRTLEPRSPSAANDTPSSPGYDSVTAGRQLGDMLDLASRYDLPDTVARILDESERLNNPDNSPGETPDSRDRLSSDRRVSPITLNPFNRDIRIAVFNATLNENSDVMRVLVDRLGEEAIMGIALPHSQNPLGGIHLESQVAGETLSVTQEQINQVAQQALGRPLLDAQSAIVLESLMQGKADGITVDGQLSAEEARSIDAALPDIELSEATPDEIVAEALRTPAAGGAPSKTSRR